jgi:hypothetical protein
LIYCSSAAKETCNNNNYDDYSGEDSGYGGWNSISRVAGIESKGIEK